MTTNNWQPNLTQKRVLAKLNRQKILLLGAGREGLSTYIFLREQFPKMRLMVADQQSRLKLSSAWKKYLAHDPYLMGSFGKHYLNCVTNSTYIFKTPGIPLTIPQLQTFLQRGGIISSQTECFFKLARGKIIGITGTKGKSTTASLIAHTLSFAKKPVLLMGNIGTPPLSMISQTTHRTLSVLELSAHQLQDLHTSPHIGVLQNITSEHLDYYPNLQAYQNAKSSLVRYQKSSDYLIYCDEFAISRQFAQLSKAQLLPFGLKDQVSHRAFVDRQAIYYRPQQGQPQAIAIIKRKQLKLLGKHNLYNIMPAIIIGKHFGLTDECLAQALASFTPLRHRLELVGNYQDVTYINDSLSTTPQAAVAALKIFHGRPIYLLAGGFERRQNYQILAKQILTQNVPAVILFPTTGKRIKQTIIDLAIAKKQLAPDFYHVNTMPEALKICQKLVKPGSIVLLSPAAASFDSFKDYADRGNQFCHEVAKMQQRQK